MLIVLPTEKNGLPSLLTSITSAASNFEMIFNHNSYRKTLVRLGLPKFSIHSDTISLVGELTSMGMGDLFGSGADLSGITGNHEISVSEVLHKAVVDVSRFPT